MPRPPSPPRARLDVPALPESAHREGDQQHRERDQQEAQETEQARAERWGREAGLVAVEPRERGEAREEDQEDRERACDREHAPVPAICVEGEEQEEEDVGDLDRLRALELVPAADRDDQDEHRGHHQEEGDDRPRPLRLGQLAVGV